MVQNCLPTSYTSPGTYLGYSCCLTAGLWHGITLLQLRDFGAKPSNPKLPAQIMDRECVGTCACHCLHVPGVLGPARTVQ